MLLVWDREKSRCCCSSSSKAFSNSNNAKGPVFLRRRPEQEAQQQQQPATMEVDYSSSNRNSESSNSSSESSNKNSESSNSEGSSSNSERRCSRVAQQQEERAAAGITWRQVGLSRSKRSISEVARAARAAADGRATMEEAAWEMHLLR